MTPGLVARINVDGTYRWLCGLIGVTSLFAVFKNERPLTVIQNVGQWLTERTWQWTETVQNWISGREAVVGWVVTVIACLAALIVGDALKSLSSLSSTSSTRASSTWLVTWAVGLQTTTALRAVLLTIVILGLGVLLQNNHAETNGRLDQLDYLVLIVIFMFVNAAAPLLWTLGASKTKQQVDAKVT